MSIGPAKHVIKKHLQVLRDDQGGDLEPLCVHCGACCYAKVEVDRVPVIVKALRCKYLAFDREGQSRCTVYRDRRKKAPWCKNVQEAIQARIFPQECPYVADLSDYAGPRNLDAALERAAEEKLRERYRGKAREEWADPVVWDAFLAGGSP